MKKYQNGFAIFEVLFFVLLAAVLIGGAFYVGKHSSKSKTTSNQTVASQNTAAQSKAGPKVDAPLSKEDQLKNYLLKTCNSSDSAAINAMFANQAAQSVDTDNVKVQGDYAIANVNCTLNDGTQLSTLFAKYSSNNWKLVVTGPTEVSCGFLTTQGFPDQLKAPYCQNQEGSFGG